MDLLIANFAAELDMARVATGNSQPALPKHVRKHLSAAASSLCSLSATAEVAVALTDSEIDSLTGELPFTPSRIAAWAETDAVQRLRAAVCSGNQTPTGVLDPAWTERLFYARCDPELVRRANDRRTWFELGKTHGWLLPESRTVTSVSQLLNHIPSCIAQSADKAWLARAPFGAAGRERVHRWGTDLSADIVVRIERLLQRYGVLLCAPMMKRIVDFGVCGFVSDRQSILAAPHRLHTASSGVFHSVERDFGDNHLVANEHAAVVGAARIASDHLRDIGFRGPFGIDGFVYEDLCGNRVVHPVCEINARLTFGHLSWARELSAVSQTSAASPAAS